MTTKALDPCERCNGQTIERLGVRVCTICDWHMYWPPVGQHAEVWARFVAAVGADFVMTDDMAVLAQVIARWLRAASSPVREPLGGWEDEIDWAGSRPSAAAVAATADRAAGHKTAGSPNDRSERIIMSGYESQVVLGEKYRESLTGYEGIATATTFYLHGCERVTLEKWDAPNAVLKELTFDAPRLVHVPTDRTGGVKPDTPRRSANQG